VHHDLWDFDLPAAPALFDVKRNGRTIPAVGVITKMSTLFIFNRETGEPIYGMEERPVPASDVPGEAAWPTQPFPVKPPPLGRTTVRSGEGLQHADARGRGLLQGSVDEEQALYEGHLHAGRRRRASW
jgi:quinoprotein glucose dehydrogenase